MCMWQQYPKHSTSMARMVGLQEGSHFSKKATVSPIWSMQKTTLEILKPCDKTCCGLTKPRWNFLTKMQNVTFGANATQHITQRTQSLLRSMVVAQHHVMGMFLISRDWGTCQDGRENGWSKIQKNPRGKPAALCKKAEIGMEVHVSAWKWPNAHSQSHTGVAKEQKHKCPRVAQSEPRT